jgi:hypothetical protein
MSLMGGGDRDPLAEWLRDDPETEIRLEPVDPGPMIVPRERPRRVVIDVEADRLRVGTSGSVADAHPRLGAERVLENLNRAIRREMAGWGPAGRGHRWKPEFEFRVAAGGLANWTRMRLSGPPEIRQAPYRYPAVPAPSIRFERPSTPSSAAAKAGEARR